MKKHVLKQKLEVLKKSKNEEEDSYKKQNNAVGRIKDERERNRPICKECETKRLLALFCANPKETTVSLGI